MKLCPLEQQIKEAALKDQDVTPYPEFIKQQIREGELQLNEASELDSYNCGQPQPPVQYYRKVS